MDLLTAPTLWVIEPELGQTITAVTPFHNMRYHHHGPVRGVAKGGKNADGLIDLFFHRSIIDRTETERKLLGSGAGCSRRGCASGWEEEHDDLNGEATDADQAENEEDLLSNLEGAESLT